MTAVSYDVCTYFFIPDKWYKITNELKGYKAKKNNTHSMVLRNDKEHYTHVKPTEFS